MKRAVMWFISMTVFIAMAFTSSLTAFCDDAEAPGGLDKREGDGAEVSDTKSPGPIWTTLQDIEGEYRAAISQSEDLSVDAFISLSHDLYQNIKVTGISDSGDEMSDMLLFEYGIWDWGDENGRHFGFSIARQFFAPDDDEPYQLVFSLIFDPAPFANVRGNTIWSDGYGNVDDFFADITKTDGYKLAEQAPVLKYELTLDYLG